MDKDTERFFKSRIEKTEHDVVEDKSLYDKVLAFPVRILTNIDEGEKYNDYLPVYSLKVAAGKFGDGKEVKEEGWMEVNIGRTLNKRMFIVKVVGHSMEPLISNNSYCVFSTITGGSRQGKIVLVQHHCISDTETGGSYTVKKYSSEKQFEKDDTWRHEKIILEPLNDKYEPIIIPPSDADDFKIIAEFVAVL